MSAPVPGLQPEAATGQYSVPGSLALVILATILVLAVLREATRGTLPVDVEQRARTAVLIIGVPLLLAGATVVVARFLELVT